MFALTVLVIMCSCEKSEPNVFPLASDFFRAEKMSWIEQTKAGSDLDKTDAEWEIGDEVTVFSESGECHNFKVVECDGLSASFDCMDYSFSEGVKYNS